MADNIEQRTGFVFDFAAAVEGVKCDYPDVAKTITFIDLDAPDAAEQIARWKENRGRVINDMLNSKDFTPEGSGFALTDVTKGERILAAHSRYRAKLPILQDQPEKQPAYVFYHELGHILSPRRNMMTTVNELESIADAFAALTGLARGFITPDDLRKIAEQRTKDFMREKMLEHMSAPVLDWLAANTLPGHFAGLEPAEILKLSEEYARALIPSLHDHSEVESAMFVRGKEWRGLGDLALIVPALSSSFYLAARALNEAMEEGLIDETQPLYGAGYWDEVRETIAKKTEMLAPDIKKALQTGAGFHA